MFTGAGGDAAGGSTATGGTTATGGSTAAGGATATGGTGGTVAYAPCPTNGSACKILPFGDSITRGAKSTDDGGYRSPLFKLIVAAKQKATFVGSAANGPAQVSGQPFPRMHEGHAGWTIDPGYNMLSSSYSGISKLVPSPALDANPSIILLMIGTNDLFARDTAGMATRLEALLDKIVQNAPNALIVLAQLTPLGHDDPNSDGVQRQDPGDRTSSRRERPAHHRRGHEQAADQRAHRRHAPDRSRVRVHGEHLVCGNQGPVAEMTGLRPAASSTEIL